MTDREKIVSEGYYDLITDYISPPGTGLMRDFVIQPVDGEIAVTYIRESDTDPINLTDYTYPVLPKVYGLMQMETGNGQGFDPTSLIYSGITQVQRAPLNLTGKGVVIGFLDTGERVIIMSS